MLPTGKVDGMLWETTSGQLIHTHVSGKFKTEYKPFDLYLVDDSSIKEGDWYFLLKDKTPMTTCNDEIVLENLNILGCKKIIATTDKYLGLEDVGKAGYSVDEFYPELPQLQQSFIEEYCGNPVGKVMVEYEYYKQNGMPDESSSLRLKLNQDNTVNITSVEDDSVKMYTAAEVIVFCEEAVAGWIEENL